MQKRRLAILAPRALSGAAARVPIAQPGSWRTDKQSTAQRGYGYRWQKARAEHLRAHPFCEFCLRDYGIACRTIEDVILACAERGLPLPYATVVDHRTPHRGDQALFWDRANWQSLCSRHHSGEKQRLESAEA